MKTIFIVLFWLHSPRGQEAAASGGAEEDLGRSSELHLWPEGGLQQAFPRTAGCHVSPITRNGRCGSDRVVFHHGGVLICTEQAAVLQGVCDVIGLSACVVPRMATRGRQRRMPTHLFLHLKLVCAH